ncbi:cell division protein ZapA [Vibrio genomosp. F10]|uniref:Cell division protein ZapA n=2 Tax=Vibrio genomosp. F10 TaxID=723171 RepID=A0A1B9QXK6_9VIBR|nr:cell division protein ZapA [Vibrio genomosp. F10]OCH74640.1 Z-ring-associated protein [Vibrio genomosp. F10]OEE34294.1 Z-ring-associated protein [Vibrio genomosp. F10 str. ZF-129]OEE95745.1 Z-ring-associated protein [Vibrio genomosp. F10 str. 9ZC157]OEF01346.1 Z-ring-associated protein [Vibrio genomosp. F10 str. 9ZD137]OEF03786.1 Z-ring-associated protein [Vibrio genomosp. F10 str. 9ZB36]
MSNQAVDVKILGKLTRVNCPPGQEESLQHAAIDLDKRLSELAERTKVTNEVQLLTFAALNICYELHSKNKDDQSQQSKLTERMELLSASLDEALSKVTQEQQ